MAKFKWNGSGSGSSVRTGYINTDYNRTGKYTGGESGKPRKRPGFGGNIYYSTKIDIEKWRVQKNPKDKHASLNHPKETVPKKIKRPFDLQEYLVRLDYYPEELNDKGLIMMIPLETDSMKTIAEVLSRKNRQLVRIDITKNNIKETLKSFLKKNPIQHVIIQYDKVKYYCELDGPIKQEESKKHIYYSLSIKELKKVLYELRAHSTKCKADPYGIVIIYKNA